MLRTESAKAVPLFERTLQIVSKQFAADHPEVADTHYQLARAYREQPPEDPALLAEARAGVR